MIKLTVAELEIVLDKIIPADSTASLKIRSLVDQTVSLKPIGIVDIYRGSDEYEILLTVAECPHIAQSIVKKQKTDEWSVSYMLVLFYQKYGPLNKDSSAWHFMSIYLQIIIRITLREDNHFAKVSQLGVRLRMGLKAHNPQSEIINQLIDIHSYHDSLENIIKAIRQYEISTKQSEASGLTINKKLAEKIGRIRLVYEVVAEDKVFISKSYSKPNKIDNNGSDLQSVYLNGDDEPLRAIIFGEIHKNDNVSRGENIADDDLIRVLDNDFKPYKSIAKSSELQQWKIKNNFLHAKRNQFFFPTSLRQLSLISIQTLFVTIWQLYILVDSDNRTVYTVLLLTLLSGRHIQEVIDELGREKSQRKWLINKVGVKGSYSVLNIAINTTVNRRSHLLQHRQSFDNAFMLPLPARLYSVIETPLTCNKEDLFKILKGLNIQLNFPALNYKHIESALYCIIKNELNEPLYADLITAVDVKHSSPLYYTSIELEGLNDTYRRAITLMSRQSAFDTQEQNAHCYVANIENTQCKPYVGSDMALNQNTCKNFFDELANAVESYEGRLKRGLNIRQDRYIEQFNEYSVWLWHTIMIQTGIRPVIHAPGVLNQLDFENSLLWVSDKEERLGQDQGRLIPLSQFLITAIKNYIDYIKQFAAVHNLIYPAEQFPIDDILNSRQPLIQFFSKKPQGFSGITPSKVRYHLRGFFSHQDNWLRHQLRTMLTDRAPEHLICALYGHEHADQEAMHPMSSLSINELKRLREYLDEIADELNLRQVKVI